MVINYWNGGFFWLSTPVSVNIIFTELHFSDRLDITGDSAFPILPNGELFSETLASNRHTEKTVARSWGSGLFEDRLRPDFRKFLDDAVPSHCKMLDDQCTFIEDGFGT
jgi:hypothetical protein